MVAKQKRKGGRKAKKYTVTAKNKLFIENFIATNNLTQSWIDARYSHISATQNAREALKKPHIKEYYEKRLAEITKEAGVTTQDVINELVKIGFSNFDDYFDLIEENVVVEEDGENVEKIISKPMMKAPDKITRDALAAVSGFKTVKGQIQFTFHPKIEALKSIGSILGISNNAEIEKAKRIKAEEAASKPIDPLKDKTKDEIQEEINKLDNPHGMLSKELAN